MIRLLVPEIEARRHLIEVPWVAAQDVSTHWLRHTTPTWVERHFGYGIARAYAGHTDSVGAATTTYIKADLQAVAAALAAMTGQYHPLATPSHRGRIAARSVLGVLGCRSTPVTRFLGRGLYWWRTRRTRAEFRRAPRAIRRSGEGRCRSRR